MWCHPSSAVAVPPHITCQSHPPPSSHRGDQGGLQSCPAGDGAGWEHLPTTTPPPQAADLGLRCPPCSVGKEIWKGPWLICEWCQHPLSGLVESSAGQGAACIPCQLSIPQTRIPPGSGSAGPAPAPRKRPGLGGASLLPIHHPYQPALAARRSLAVGLHGRRAGAVRQETGRRHRGDKPRRQQKQQLSSLVTSKR